MLESEIKSLLAECADPHLIASAKTGTEKLWKLNALVADLRAEVFDLELKADLRHNFLMKQEGKSIPLKESEYKISEEYREWRIKKGLLQDARSVRKQMERHVDLLIQQEKFNPQRYDRVIS